MAVQQRVRVVGPAERNQAERAKKLAAIRQSPADEAPPGPWNQASQIALIAIAVVAVGAALCWASYILIPITAALITALMLGPISDRLGRARIPPVLLAIGIVVLLAIVITGLASALTGPVTEWIDRAPEIGQTLKARFGFLLEPVAAAERLQDILGTLFGGARSAMAVELKQPSVGRSLVTAVSPAIGQILVFYGTLFFLLVGRERLRRQVVLSVRGRERRLVVLRMVTGMQRDLGLYFSTIAAMNFAVGTAVTLTLLTIGMAQPLLWGILAFALNFVPLIGTAAMTGILAIAGLLTYDTVAWGLAPAILYVAIHMAESQLITPAILGNRFDVNPLVVFLSIVVWTWLWGAPGALLAAPIMVTSISVWNLLRTARLPKLPA